MVEDIRKAHSNLLSNTEILVIPTHANVRRLLGEMGIVISSGVFEKLGNLEDLLPKFLHKTQSQNLYCLIYKKNPLFIDGNQQEPWHELCCGRSALVPNCCYFLPIYFYFKSINSVQSFSS